MNATQFIKTAAIWQERQVHAVRFEKDEMHDTMKTLSEGSGYA